MGRPETLQDHRSSSVAAARAARYPASMLHASWRREFDRRAMRGYFAAPTESFANPAMGLMQIRCRGINDAVHAGWVD